MVGCGSAQFKISKWVLCEQGITVLTTANGCLWKATWMQALGYLILDPNPVPYPSPMHQCHSSQTSRDTLSSCLFYYNCPKLYCSHCEARFWGWREIRKSLLRVVLEVPSFSEKNSFQHEMKGQSKQFGLTRTLKVSAVLKIFSKPVCLHYLSFWLKMRLVLIRYWPGCAWLYISKKSRRSLNCSSGKDKTSQGMEQSQHSLISCFSQTALNKQWALYVAGSVV